MLSNLLRPGIDTRRKPRSPGQCRVRGDGLGRGLVGAWLFNEGGGVTTRNCVGSAGVNGTLTGGPTWSIGKFGNVISFDGTNDYISVDNNFAITNNVTFSAWVKFASLTGWQTILCQDTTDWSLQEGAFYFQKTSNANLDSRGQNMLGIIFPTGLGDSTSGAYNTVAAVIDKWYHVTGTYDGANVRFYQDGILVKTTARTGSIATQSGNMVLGTGYYDNLLVDYLNGLLDVILIYNRALSATEVRQLYVEPFAFLQPYQPASYFGSAAAAATTFTKMAGRGGLAGCGGVMVGPGGLAG